MLIINKRVNGVYMPWLSGQPNPPPEGRRTNGGFNFKEGEYKGADPIVAGI